MPVYELSPERGAPIGDIFRSYFQGKMRKRKREQEELQTGQQTLQNYIALSNIYGPDILKSPGFQAVAQKAGMGGLEIPEGIEGALGEVPEGHIATRTYGAFGRPKGTTVKAPSGADMLSRWRLEQLGKMTPEQRQQYMLKPPVSITMPTGQLLLTPEQRQMGAEADFEKKIAQEPLTPTELKGVKATIGEIMGTGRGLPFGIRLGAALSQDDMSGKWEEVMESTGYSARAKIQQKQIESEFDRYITTLNKGKGIGVLKGQYQWDRKKYKTGEITRQIKSIEPQTKGLTKFGAPTTREQFNRTYQRLKPEDRQAYIDAHWRPEFGRHLK